MRQMPAKAIIGLLWAIAGVSTGGCVQAQDARVILEKTLYTYQNMTSYTGKTTVDANVTLFNGKKQSVAAQSSSLLFKNPNKILLKINSNKLSVEVYSDGRNMTIYRSDAMKYYSLPAPASMHAMLPILHSRTDIDAMLDPLYFLCSSSLPSNLTDLKIKSTEKVNGRETTVITGTWKGKIAAQNDKPNVFCSEGARWTLSIDKMTSLLNRAEATVSGLVNVPSKRNGKVEAVKMAATLKMQNIIVDAKANAPIDEKLFQFTPPKGATQQKDVNELLRGGAGLKF